MRFWLQPVSPYTSQITLTGSNRKRTAEVQKASSETANNAKPSTTCENTENIIMRRTQ